MGRDTVRYPTYDSTRVSSFVLSIPGTSVLIVRKTFQISNSDRPVSSKMLDESKILNFKLIDPYDHVRRSGLMIPPTPSS